MEWETKNGAVQVQSSDILEINFKWRTEETWDDEALDAVGETIGFITKDKQEADPPDPDPDPTSGPRWTGLGQLYGHHPGNDRTAADHPQAAEGPRRWPPAGLHPAHRPGRRADGPWGELVRRRDARAEHPHRRRGRDRPWRADLLRGYADSGFRRGEGSVAGGIEEMIALLKVVW